jgi:acetylornithine deacetylase/succinyl-diaminopimelate desuccinylase-like protein
MFRPAWAAPELVLTDPLGGLSVSGGHLRPTCIGGTLPATDLFERSLGAKTLFFWFSTADENLHAPNEFMRIRRLREECAPESYSGACSPPP